MVRVNWLKVAHRLLAILRLLAMQVCVRFSRFGVLSSVVTVPGDPILSWMLDLS